MHCSRFAPNGWRRVLARNDNGSYIRKQQLRRRLREKLGDDACVLEGFTGEGRLYRGCWAGLRGATIDLDGDKVAAAAAERPTWAVYCGDTEQALLAGWMAHVPWDVLDLDPYGSPWHFLQAWFVSSRVRASTTHVMVTDGFFTRRGLAFPCRALWPTARRERMTISTRMYEDTVRERLGQWARDAGCTIGRLDSIPDHMMRLYQIEVHSSRGCSSSVGIA